MRHEHVGLRLKHNNLLKNIMRNARVRSLSVCFRRKRPTDI